MLNRGRMDIGMLGCLCVGGVKRHAHYNEEISNVSLVISGKFKGALATHAPFWPYIFYFHAVFSKILSNNRLTHHRLGLKPPPGNPRSATGNELFLNIVWLYYTSME